MIYMALDAFRQKKFAFRTSKCGLKLDRETPKYIILLHNYLHIATLTIIAHLLHR